MAHILTLFKKNILPNDFPLLALWLDASISSSIIKDGSNKISQWSDISGNNKHLTQSTASYQPTYQNNALNLLPAVNFEGAELSAQQRLENASFSGLPDNLEIIVVLKRTQNDVLNAAKPILSINNNTLFRCDNGNVTARIKNTTVWEPNASIAAASVGTPFIAAMSYDKSLLSSYSNNFLGNSISKTDDIQNNGTATTLYLNYFGGAGDFAISEVIIFRKKLNDSQRAQLFAQLKDKWRIA